MDEKTAYEWAAECLKPIEGLVEPHKLQQVADKIVAALLEAAKGAAGEQEGVITSEQLAEIEARAAAATPGKWMVREAGGRPSVWVNGCKLAAVEAPNCIPPLANYGRKQNAAFIAAAHADVPALLAEVEWLRNALQKAQAR